MFRDAKLRLLMNLVGFERLGIEDVPDAQWIIPSALSASQLREAHSIIQRHRDNPTKSYGDDDPISAEEMIRRKPLPKTSRAEFDDESDNEGLASSGNEDFQFPVGGPRDTNSRTAALEDLMKKRRKRRSPHSDDEGGISEGTREARRKARRQTELEKISKIKSAEFVYDSDEDDEADADFFAREEQRRKGYAAKMMEVLRSGMIEARKNGKRKSEDENDNGKRKIRLLKPSVTAEGHEEESFEPELEFPSPVPQYTSDGSESLDDSSRSSTPVEETNKNPVLRDIPGNVLSLNRSTSAMKNHSIHSDSSGENEDEDTRIKALPRRRYRPALMFDSGTD